MTVARYSQPSQVGIYVMSPTNFLPGAGDVKSRRTRSGMGCRAGIGLGQAVPPRTGLAGHQPQLAHEGPDQLRGAALAAAGQLGVHPPVAVGLIELREDIGDQVPKMLAARRRRRWWPITPLVVARGGHLQP